MGALRCWPGCVAVVHGAANPENNGKVVQCIEYLGLELFMTRGGRLELFPTWRVDRALSTWRSNMDHCHAPDHILTPITPDPAATTTDTPAAVGAPAGVAA